VIRRAPLGDPIEFRLRGYCLSLRDEQARHVMIATA
jgi:Fe2+ transport system protein FeoA